MDVRRRDQLSDGAARGWEPLPAGGLSEEAGGHDRVRLAQPSHGLRSDGVVCQPEVWNQKDEDAWTHSAPWWKDVSLCEPLCLFCQLTSDASGGLTERTDDWKRHRLFPNHADAPHHDCGSFGFYYHFITSSIAMICDEVKRASKQAFK